MRQDSWSFNSSVIVVIVIVVIIIIIIIIRGESFVIIMN
jgi:hypothetical protein